MRTFATYYQTKSFVDMAEKRDVAIGSKIKSLRESKGILAGEMADRSGLDVEFYNLLEEDGVIPAIGDLIKISRVLGVRLGMLLDDYQDDGPVVTKADESCANAALRSKQGEYGNYSYESLSARKGNRHMETYSVNLAPAGLKEKKLSNHEGEEFLYVLDGNVEVIYGKEKYILEPGDSIYYDSIVPHHVGSASSESSARLLAVIYIPA